MSYSNTYTDLQTVILSTTEWTILIVVSCIIAIGTFIVYRLNNEDIDNTKKSIMIKVDRNGKHRYEVKESLDNSRMQFWLKIIFYIIGIGLLFIPIHHWFYKS